MINYSEEKDVVGSRDNNGTSLLVIKIGKHIFRLPNTKKTLHA